MGSLYLYASLCHRVWDNIPSFTPNTGSDYRLSVCSSVPDALWFLSQWQYSSRQMCTSSGFKQFRKVDGSCFIGISYFSFPKFYGKTKEIFRGLCEPPEPEARGFPSLPKNPLISCVLKRHYWHKVGDQKQTEVKAWNSNKQLWEMLTTKNMCRRIHIDWLEKNSFWC